MGGNHTSQSKGTTSQHVIDHVRRAENGIDNFHRYGLNADSVLRKNLQTWAISVTAPPLAERAPRLAFK